MNTIISTNTPRIQPETSELTIPAQLSGSRESPYFAPGPEMPSANVTPQPNHDIAAQVPCGQNKTIVSPKHLEQHTDNNASKTFPVPCQSNAALPVTMNGERVNFSQMTPNEILSVKKTGPYVVEILPTQFHCAGMQPHEAAACANTKPIAEPPTLKRKRGVKSDVNLLQTIVNEAISGGTELASKTAKPATSKKKKKKRAKKPPLKVGKNTELPTMIPPLIDPTEKQYSCPDCPRKFSWSFQLQQHTRTHSGERPFICNECPQAYKRREHLQRHERIHTGERPFVCDDCGKKYRRKTQLIRHARMHTGERPYLCTICSKSFRRRGHLSRHFKTHATEILKKSGINPESLDEASALMSASVPHANKTTKK